MPFIGKGGGIGFISPVEDTFHKSSKGVHPIKNEPKDAKTLFMK